MQPSSYQPAFCVSLKLYEDYAFTPLHHSVVFIVENFQHENTLLVVVVVQPYKFAPLEPGLEQTDLASTCSGSGVFGFISFSINPQ